jgi:hypothetical protein
MVSGGTIGFAGEGPMEFERRMKKLVQWETFKRPRA